MGRRTRAREITTAFTAGIVVGAAAVVGVGIAIGSAAPDLFASSMPPQPTQVFELRTYTAAEGKHDALLTRFRDHTMRIFEKHGMANVGYWTPQEAPDAGTTLIYLLAHPSRDAADAGWQAFLADPEWQGVFEASRSEGPLIAGLDRVFLEPTDFSPMR